MEANRSDERPAPGRRPKYDWDQMYAEIAVRADLDGLPDRQAELVDAMAQWCLDNWGEEPARSGLSEKIAPIYRHLRRVRKSR